MWFKEFHGIGGVDANLEDAAAGENFEWTDMYARMAREAREEGFEDLAKKFPSQLSGGEAQRGAFVRALINDPDVVFADEPTGALNSAGVKAVLDVLTDINESGQTVLMVTHDIKSARRANRIIYLQDGGIMGELKLGKYVSGDKERHEKIRRFLEEMGW